jgi:hypothetical protein
MYYLVYRVTNSVNGKSYTGSHKTINKEDGYMGSGKLIRSAIKKYGIEVFSKEILFEASSSEEMFAKEKELVVLGSRSYNLKHGGFGGFDFINRAGLNHKGFDTAAERNRVITPFKPGHKIRITESGREKLSVYAKNHRHTEESKRKISLSKMGHKVSEKTRLLMSKGAALQLGKKRGSYKKKLESEQNRRVWTALNTDRG